MVSFAVFLVIAAFSLSSLLVLFYKYNIKNFISLAGALVMLTGSVLVLLLSESPDNAIPGVIFGVGAFAYIFGIYRYSVSVGQKTAITASKFKPGQLVIYCRLPLPEKV